MLKDIELLDSGSILKGLRFPHKIKDVTQIVITAGQFSCLVDFRMWSLKAPAVALFLHMLSIKISPESKLVLISHLQ